MVHSGQFTPRSPVDVLSSGYQEIQQDKAPLIGTTHLTTLMLWLQYIGLWRPTGWALAALCVHALGPSVDSLHTVYQWRHSLTCLLSTSLVMLIFEFQKHARTHLMPLCPGLPRFPSTRKVKINLDFTEARDSEWQWHQLGHMQVCTSLQAVNYASTPPLSFYMLDALHVAQPTASKH